MRGRNLATAASVTTRSEIIRTGREKILLLDLFRFDSGMGTSTFNYANLEVKWSFKSTHLD